ncbi:MAG: hypothetical protein DRP71_10625 [Verrucomicrobia bacterium]|nr:MAG: hypothetical protein DRP71_10625 [Verrucomicrobiota bacterium]
MNKLIFLSMATAGLILTPAAFAGEGCSSSAEKNLQTAQTDGAACAASTKTVQLAKVDDACCPSKEATQVALADSAACSSKKAIQVADADGSACASKASARDVALVHGAACTASSKAIQVAQKSDCESSCDSKAQKIVLAQAEAKASDECGDCSKAEVAPTVAKTTDDASAVVASQE